MHIVPTFSTCTGVGGIVTICVLVSTFGSVGSAGVGGGGNETVVDSVLDALVFPVGSMLLSGIVPEAGMFISGSSVTRNSGHLP